MSSAPISGSRSTPPVSSARQQLQERRDVLAVELHEIEQELKKEGVREEARRQWLKMHDDGTYAAGFTTRDLCPAWAPSDWQIEDFDVPEYERSGGETVKFKVSADGVYFGITVKLEGFED